jgi:hypothetical protein
MLSCIQKPVTSYDQGIERSEGEIVLVFFFFYLWPRPSSSGKQPATLPETLPRIL